MMFNSIQHASARPEHSRAGRRNIPIKSAACTREGATNCRPSSTWHGAIPASTDASRRFAADTFHEGRAERTERTGIGNVWRFRKIIEISLIDDDP
jgi:hypothetical protein